jgi:hypothetical protein
MLFLMSELSLVGVFASKEEYQSNVHPDARADVHMDQAHLDVRGAPSSGSGIGE